VAFFSIHGRDDSDYHFEFEEVQLVISNLDIPKCKGVPCHLWMAKCVTLHNDNGVAMAERIYNSINSDLVIKMVVFLGRRMLLFRYQRALRRMSFLKIEGTPFELG
jgi:hypothetical protein